MGKCVNPDCDSEDIGAVGNYRCCPKCDWEWYKGGEAFARLSTRNVCPGCGHVYDKEKEKNVCPVCNHVDTGGTMTSVREKIERGED